MLKTALVGCGKIADQHVQAIARIPGAAVHAVCDREILMARQLGERFGISQCYADVGEMLRVARPDVVHISTPPQSHFELGKQCLEAGCHVYLEKPFTVTSEEAIALVQMAEARGRYITAGHNLQFTLEMLEMRRLVREGFLGGTAVHVESHFPYSLDDPTYIGPVLGNRSHWVRQLPGQLLHNIISHPVAKLAEFLDDEITEVVATGWQSPKLQRMNGQDVLDELRVMIRDRNGTTAFLCFSTQIRPGLNQLRICGPKNSLIVDHGSGSVLRQRAAAHKSYLTFFAPPIKAGLEHMRNARRNIVNFLRGRLHQDAGMKELIEQFYWSIRIQGQPPIPHREIVLTARIMDEIFTQIYPEHSPSKPAAVLAPAV
jgi:predicted dehydrogenase